MCFWWGLCCCKGCDFIGIYLRMLNDFPSMDLTCLHRSFSIVFFMELSRFCWTIFWMDPLLCFLALACLAFVFLGTTLASEAALRFDLELLNLPWTIVLAARSRFAWTERNCVNLKPNKIFKFNSFVYSDEFKNRLLELFVLETNKWIERASVCVCVRVICAHIRFFLHIIRWTCKKTKRVQTRCKHIISISYIFRKKRWKIQY